MMNMLWARGLSMGVEAYIPVASLRRGVSEILENGVLRRCSFYTAFPQARSTAFWGFEGGITLGV